MMSAFLGCISFCLLLVFRFFSGLVLLGSIFEWKKPIGRLKETTQQYEYRAKELGKIQ
jgi:hypothetical protein